MSTWTKTTYAYINETTERDVFKTRQGIENLIASRRAGEPVWLWNELDNPIVDTFTVNAEPYVVTQVKNWSSGETWYQLYHKLPAMSSRLECQYFATSFKSWHAQPFDYTRLEWLAYLDDPAEENTYPVSYVARLRCVGEALVKITLTVHTAISDPLLYEKTIDVGAGESIWATLNTWVTEVRG